MTPAVQRVAVIGAECTGKTSLCQSLSLRLQGLSFEEPLRNWVQAHGKPPTSSEQPTLIQIQKDIEACYAEQAQRDRRRWVFCDSAPLVTAVYSQVYFNDSSLLAVALSHHRQHYGFTLLCDCDLPWQEDPGQRDGLDVQQQTHRLLVQTMQAYGLPYFLIQGQGHRRALLAEQFITGVDFGHR